MAAVVLFLLEILERRTVWLFRLFVRKPAVTKPGTIEEEVEPSTQTVHALPRILPRAVRKAAVRQPSLTTAADQPKPATSTLPTTGQPGKTVPEADSGKSTLDAFREASAPSAAGEKTPDSMVTSRSGFMASWIASAAHTAVPSNSFTLAMTLNASAT